jgi:hypothetical protein
MRFPRRIYARMIPDLKFASPYEITARWSRVGCLVTELELISLNQELLQAEEAGKSHVDDGPFIMLIMFPPLVLLQHVVY